MSALLDNAQALEQDFQWLSQVIQIRFTHYFQQEGAEMDIYAMKLPDLGAAGPYSEFIQEMESRLEQDFGGDNASLHELKIAHRVLLLLTLAPHIKPAILDVFFARNKLYDRPFTEFGGVSSQQHGGFLPTGETVLFLLAGADVTRRIQYQFLFKSTYFFFRENVVTLRSQRPNEPFLRGVLTLSDEYLTRLTTGEEHQPRYGSTFPAIRLQTDLKWEDLVLDQHLSAGVTEIAAWVNHKDTIRDELGLSKFLKSGFQALFYGPPGTGKTLCATLLGKQTQCPVYRISLTQAISQYIGETEKNLAHLFDVAERKNWVLFFDEADALFGKRTTKNGHDRYANQEVAYLLQRIEDYNGLVILATNRKEDMDEALTRRFQAVLHFPIPAPRERLQLWRKIFGEQLTLADDVDLVRLANDFELTGGSIVNVVRYCALATLQRHGTEVKRQDVQQGVKRALLKIAKRGSTA